MNILEAIRVLDETVVSPSEGLPYDLFCYVTTITPMVNVDLLIKDEKQRTLLAWRDDPHCGRGWHVPGGIVRFRETLEARIQKVAETELGCAVNYDLKPIAINEIIKAERTVRGHFISLWFGLMGALD